MHALRTCTWCSIVCMLAAANIVCVLGYFYLPFDNLRSQLIMQLAALKWKPSRFFRVAAPKQQHRLNSRIVEHSAYPGGRVLRPQNAWNRRPDAPGLPKVASTCLSIPIIARNQPSPIFEDLHPLQLYIVHRELCFERLDGVGDCFPLQFSCVRGLARI